MVKWLQQVHVDVLSQHNGPVCYWRSANVVFLYVKCKARADMTCRDPPWTMECMQGDEGEELNMKGDNVVLILTLHHLLHAPLAILT